MIKNDVYFYKHYKTLPPKKKTILKLLNRKKFRSLHCTNEVLFSNKKIQIFIQFTSEICHLHLVIKHDINHKISMQF